MKYCKDILLTCWTTVSFSKNKCAPWGMWLGVHCGGSCLNCVTNFRPSILISDTFHALQRFEGVGSVWTGVLHVLLRTHLSWTPYLLRWWAVSSVSVKSRLAFSDILSSSTRGHIGVESASRAHLHAGYRYLFAQNRTCFSYWAWSSLRFHKTKWNNKSVVKLHNIRTDENQFCCSQADTCVQTNGRTDKAILVCAPQECDCLKS
jgi:hypothetical protein